LIYASLGGNVEVVKFLVEKKGIPFFSQKIDRAVEEALNLGHVEILKYFEELGITLTKCNYLSYKNPKTIKFLLEKGWSKIEHFRHVEDCPALFSLKKNLTKNFENFEYYLNNFGAKIVKEDLVHFQENPKMWKILWDILSQKKDENVEEYVKNYKDLNRKTFLHKFVSDDNFEEIVKILVHLIDVNSVDCSQNTPLHFSTQKNCIHLLAKGASVNIKNSSQKIPLFNICEIKYEETNSQKNEAGEFYESSRNNDDGSGGFQENQVEIQKQKKEFDLHVLKLFIEHGADVNQTTSEGFTPLHFLIKNSSKFFVEKIEFFLNLTSEKQTKPLRKNIFKFMFKNEIFSVKIMELLIKHGHTFDLPNLPEYQRKNSPIFTLLSESQKFLVDKKPIIPVLVFLKKIKANPAISFRNIFNQIMGIYEMFSGSDLEMVPYALNLYSSDDFVDSEKNTMVHTLIIRRNTTMLNYVMKNMEPKGKYLRGNFPR
jgi:hypothetical protein